MTDAKRTPCKLRKVFVYALAILIVFVAAVVLQVLARVAEGGYYG